MESTLTQISTLLRQGLNTSGQGSYQRRAPSPAALRIIQEARRELKSWIAKNGETIESLRLLALAEEALLNFDSAVVILENLINRSSSPNRKDIKRLAACREAGQMWRELVLSPDDLVALGHFLKDKLLDAAPEDSFRWTEEWLVENKASSRTRVIAALRNLGYSSDYAVLHNLVPG